jgi:hypothetical protein
MMRRIEVTVRLPGARIAPAIRTLACSQTGYEKTGAKMAMTLMNVSGKEIISSGPFRSKS